MAKEDHILERLEEKKADYVRYRFSVVENDAFKTFFDLAQEFDDIKEFYKLCVSITRAFFGLESRLFIYDPGRKAFLQVACTGSVDTPPGTVFKGDADNPTNAYLSPEGSLLLAIRGKELMNEQSPVPGDGDVLGFLEVFSDKVFDDHVRLFFEKYANRIGFNLHNRLLVMKNVEHLRFIRSLVADIEHNVIVPNMIYKLYLRRLNREIMKNQDVEAMLDDMVARKDCEPDELEKVRKYVHEANEGLLIQEDNLVKHHSNMSLFIETLFRKSHFDQGSLMLKTQECNIKKDVIEPQLERYKERFRDSGISIDDRMSFIPDEEVIGVVDLGLIAQVFANLFSNALKYARAVWADGERVKYVAYGHEVAKDFFGPGKDGVKYNVFSTGPHISPDDRDRLFEEGFRADESQEVRGSGHGLAFIKNVVELHNGRAGYEPTDLGNNFFIVLPRENSE